MRILKNDKNYENYKKKIFLKNKKVRKFLLLLFSIFLMFLYFLEGENIWSILRSIFLGLLGIGSIFVPIIIFFVTFNNNFKKKSEKNKKVFNKIDIFLICVLPILFNIFLCLFLKKDTNFNIEYFKTIFLEGKRCGGIICAFISLLIVYFVGMSTARTIILILMVINIISIMFIHKVKLKFCFKSVINYVKFIKNKEKKCQKTNSVLEYDTQEPTGRMLIETLESFGISAKIINVSHGPSVTRYEIQPAPGVKLNKITSLSDNIALSLSALGVRIEAPIPGRSAVGVEIPKKNVSTVNINELLKSSEFKDSTHFLPVVLGKDITGKCIVSDISKMPHLLIAGSTGSGKSVCVNSFIASIIYKLDPSDVRLLMIDPKVVELSVYNGIPHLLIPVVTDPKKAAGALSWAVEEMLFRYKIFAEVGVRDLESYNKFVKKSPNVIKKNENLPSKMARMLIIIDELADLMMASPKEIEDYICRLAQMARAAGMHLIIATQRPSVDVITGVIKANVPSRIALAVSSQVDSRTIIDTAGAEKLIGRGDMLFSPLGSIKPIRVQGCYIADEDIQKIVSESKSKGEVFYDKKILEEINKASFGDDLKTSAVNKNPDEPDPKLDEAVKNVIESGIASISFITKTLGISYKRSGKIVDEMEKLGVIGPYEGTKPRKIIMTYKDYMNIDKS